MSRNFDPLDARKRNLKTKRAEMLGDLLPDEDKEKMENLLPDEDKEELEKKPSTQGPTIPESSEPLPPAARKLPGGPKHTVRPGFPGQTSESLDVPGYTQHGPGAQTGMTPEELKAERERLKVDRPKSPESSEDPETTGRVTWRDIAKRIKDKEQKQVQEARYGPSDILQNAASTLSEFGDDLTSVDLNAAQNYIKSLDLPEMVKGRAERSLRGKKLDPGHPAADDLGEVAIAGQKVLQHALTQLGAHGKAATDKAIDWFHNTKEGEQFLERARAQYLIRNTVRMLENMVLRQEGQGVIDSSPKNPRSTDQRKELLRLKKLKKQLDSGELTKEQYQKAVKNLDGDEEEESSKYETTRRPQEPEPSKAVNPQISALNDLQRRYNTGEISETEYKQERARLLKATAINLRKYGFNASETMWEDLVATLHSGKITPEQFWTIIRTHGIQPPERVVGRPFGSPVHAEPSVDEMPPVEASKLNLRKTSTDTAGPGGEGWFSDYESGDTFPAMSPQKRRHRFPFHNKPKDDVKTNAPSAHGLPVPDGSAPAGDDNWGLLASVDGIKTRKSADNDLFESHSFGELSKGPWFTYTLFKKAYEKLRPGDIIVQYGDTPNTSLTLRRRFGTIKNARKNISEAILPALATVAEALQKEADKSVLPNSTRVPGRPTPSDSLHDVPDSKDNPAGGVYGPRTGEYDKSPWQGNRDGFDRPCPRREQDMKRNVLPYEDQEMSNQTKIFNRLSLKKHAGVPTYEQLQQGVNAGHITPEEMQQMMQYYGIEVPPQDFGGVSEWDPNLEKDIGDPGRALLGNNLNLRKYGETAYILTEQGKDALMSGVVPEHMKDVLQYINDRGPANVGGEIDFHSVALWTELYERFGARAGEVLRELLGSSEHWWVSEVPLKYSNVGNYAAPVVETPEERAGSPEQSVVKPINWDPKRQQVKKPKRYDLNESQLYNQNEHTDNPLTHYTKKDEPAKMADGGWPARLDLLNASGWQLTEKGREMRADGGWQAQNQKVTQFLNLISMYPDVPLAQALTDYYTLSGVKSDPSDMARTAQEAVTLGYATYDTGSGQQTLGDWRAENDLPREEPPEGWNWGTFTPASKLNLKKRAGILLTQKGKDLFTEAKIDKLGQITFPAWVYSTIPQRTLEAIELIHNFPERSLNEHREHAKAFDIQIGEGFQDAIAQGYIALIEEPFSDAGEEPPDLPDNTPGGIA